MKKPIKTTVWLVLVLSLSLILLSCGNGTPEETTTTVQTTETTTDETTTEPDDTDATREETTDQDDEYEPADIRIGALRGPTGMGLVHLMASQDAGTAANHYQFELASAPDEIVASLTSGQVDIAAVPTNLAAVLYQRTNQRVKLLAVNTLGVLYILEDGDTVQTVADLEGKTIESTGQGAVPEYALNYVLAENGLTDLVEIVFRSEHAELATLAVAGQSDLVMLPEPFVTSVLSQNSDFRIALDLTQEWQAVEAAQGRSSELAMGALVVSSDFAEQHPQALARFLEEFEASADAANANPALTGELVEQYGIMPSAQVAARAIPNANIVAIYGSDMQPMLEPFFEVLYSANPQSVGGTLPDDDFYFVAP